MLAFSFVNMFQLLRRDRKDVYVIMPTLSDMLIVEDPYDIIYDFDNLHAAYWKSSKGKRDHGFVCQYEANLMENLLKLSDRLERRVYRPRKPYFFYVYGPKKRLVCANNFEDKVVQRLCNESKYKERRLLRYFRELLDHDVIDFDHIEQSYQSWRAHAMRGNSFYLIANMDLYFNELFHDEIGHFGLSYISDLVKKPVGNISINLRKEGVPFGSL